MGESLAPRRDDGSDALREALARLEDALARAGSPVVSLMSPGLAPEVVRAALEPLGMQPPGELLTWFGWRNGFPPGTPAWSGRTSILWWAPFSLEAAVAEYHWQKPGPEVWQWRPTWLPLAHSDSAPRMAVDCTPPQGQEATVRMADPFAGGFDEAEVSSVRGLAGVVDKWVEAIDIGAYVYIDDARGQGWDDTPRRQQRPRPWWRAALL